MVLKAEAVGIGNTTSGTTTVAVKMLKGDCHVCFVVKIRELTEQNEEQINTFTDVVRSG